MFTVDEKTEEFGAQQMRDTFNEIAWNTMNHFTSYGLEDDNASVLFALFRNSAAEKIRASYNRTAD